VAVDLRSNTEIHVFDGLVQLAVQAGSGRANQWTCQGTIRTHGWARNLDIRSIEDRPPCSCGALPDSNQVGVPAGVWTWPTS